MCHDEFADSLIRARTRRNIAGGAEGKHLQGSKLERRIRQPARHAPARCLLHRRPPIPIRLRPSRHALASLSTLCMLPCTVAGSGPADAPGAPPADNRPRLVDVRRLPSTLPPSGYETCGDGRHQPPMPVIPCTRTEAAPFATPRPACACRLSPDSPAGGSLRARRSNPFAPSSTPALTGRLRASRLGLTPLAVCLR